MILKKYIKRILFVSLLFIAGDALALTIDGNEFTKLLEVNTNDDAGYWRGMQKFYTFINNDNYIVPNRISSVSYRDSDLAGVNFAKVFAQITTVAPGTLTGSNLVADINSGNISLHGPRDEVLLSFRFQNILPDGIDVTYRSGTAGQIDVAGMFKVVGGSLFDRGILDGTFYIEIAYNRVWKNDLADLKADGGKFTFYQSAGNPTVPPTQIPEPASIALLTGGLLGAVRKKRKQV